MVDKEVLTDKQNESGYFMYFALNVRAPPRDHVTRFASFRQKSIFLLVWKNGADLWNVIWESCKKTTLQECRESRSIKLAFS